MINFTVRLALGILVLIFIVPTCAAVLVDVVRHMVGPAWDAGAVLGGVLVSAVLVWWRRPNWLIHTFIHEACHALFCLCLGVRIRAFQATDGQGGAVIHTKVDPVRTTIIAIAPYVWPLVLAPLLALRWWLDDPGSLRTALSAACGFFAVHHLHGLYHNVRLNFWGRQADLTRVGKLLSVALIVAVHCLWLAAWLTVLYPP